jgi:hypothetical protein
MKTTRYFERRVLVERPEIKIEWCEKAVKEPEDTYIQEDGRTRHWAFIQEIRKYIRVVTMPDGRLHNAFLDSDYTKRKRPKK